MTKSCLLGMHPASVQHFYLHHCPVCCRDKMVHFPEECLAVHKSIPVWSEPPRLLIVSQEYFPEDSNIKKRLTR